MGVLDGGPNVPGEGAVLGFFIPIAFGVWVGIFRPTTVTTTVLLLCVLCLGNPGETVPEETFTHSHLSWSSIIPCLLPPSFTMHCTASTCNRSAFSDVVEGSNALFPDYFGGGLVAVVMLYLNGFEFWLHFSWDTLSILCGRKCVNKYLYLYLYTACPACCLFGRPPQSISVM